jgi:hypothetical protein
VVGNGGVILGTSASKAIESHDVVIRFNQAPVMTEHKDVGDRTNFRALSKAWIHKYSLPVGSSLTHSRGVLHQIGYMDYKYTGCHQLNRVLTSAKINVSEKWYPIPLAVGPRGSVPRRSPAGVGRGVDSHRRGAGHHAAGHVAFELAQGQVEAPGRAGVGGDPESGSHGQGRVGTLLTYILQSKHQLMTACMIPM